MNNGEYLIAAGKKIRALRQSKGISLQQMAVMASNHKSCLSDIENGKMNVKIIALKRIADVLECNVKDFL